MLAVGMIYPSTGEHGLFNPKALSLLLALIGTVLSFLSDSVFERAQVWVVVIFLTLFSLLLISGFVFVHNHPQLDVSSTFDQFKVFISTICSGSMAIYWYLSRQVSYETIVKTLIYSNLCYNLAKIAVLVGLVIGYIDIFQVMEWGYSLMATGMGRSGPGRIQFSTDIPTPYLLCFVMMAPVLGVKLSPWTRWLYIITAVMSIFFSYSRYLWIVTAFVFILYVLISQTILSFAVRTLTLAAILTSVVTAIGSDDIFLILSHRFASEESVESDRARHLQVKALLEEFEKAPVFGQGLGSYADRSIRAAQQPHLYEVQWIALLMQMGVIGWLGLWGIYVLLGAPLLSPPYSKVSASFLVLYLWWVFGGFTNPFLLSLNSGVLSSLFYITGIRLNAPFRILNGRAGVKPDRLFVAK